MCCLLVVVVGYSVLLVVDEWLFVGWLLLLFVVCWLYCCVLCAIDCYLLDCCLLSIGFCRRYFLFDVYYFVVVVC